MKCNEEINRLLSRLIHEMNSRTDRSSLRYTDTWLRERIACRIRIRYGYASDTRSIRICRVFDFLLISQFLSTPVDTYLYLGYGPAQQKQCLPDALAPDARTSCGRAASSEHAQGSLVPAHRSPATSLRPHLQAAGDEPPSPARWR